MNSPNFEKLIETVINLNNQTYERQEELAELTTNLLPSRKELTAKTLKIPLYFSSKTREKEKDKKLAFKVINILSKDLNPPKTARKQREFSNDQPLKLSTNSPTFQLLEGISIIQEHFFEIEKRLILASLSFYLSIIFSVVTLAFLKSNLTGTFQYFVQIMVIILEIIIFLIAGKFILNKDRQKLIYQNFNRVLKLSLLLIDESY